MKDDFQRRKSQKKVDYLALYLIFKVIMTPVKHVHDEFVLSVPVNYVSYSKLKLSYLERI